jgi:hypothetical protein
MPTSTTGQRTVRAVIVCVPFSFAITCASAVGRGANMDASGREPSVAVAPAHKPDVDGGEDDDETAYHGSNAPNIHGTPPVFITLSAEVIAN